MRDTVTAQVSSLISSMIFISETESPLALFEWTDVHNRSSLQRKIAAVTSVTVSKQIRISPVDFLKDLQRSADPADPVMANYVRDYTRLFEMLNSHLSDLQVIQAGTVTVQLFIAGFINGECLAIHTTATET